MAILQFVILFLYENKTYPYIQLIGTFVWMIVYVVIKQTWYIIEFYMSYL